MKKMKKAMSTGFKAWAPKATKGGKKYAKQGGSKKPSPVGTGGGAKYKGV